MVDWLTVWSEQRVKQLRDAETYLRDISWNAAKWGVKSLGAGRLLFSQSTAVTSFPGTTGATWWPPSVELSSNQTFELLRHDRIFMFYNVTLGFVDRSMKKYVPKVYETSVKVNSCNKPGSHWSSPGKFAPPKATVVDVIHSLQHHIGFLHYS